MASKKKPYVLCLKRHHPTPPVQRQRLHSIQEALDQIDDPEFNRLDDPEFNRFDDHNLLRSHVQHPPFDDLLFSFRPELSVGCEEALATEAGIRYVTVTQPFFKSTIMQS